MGVEVNRIVRYGECQSQSLANQSEVSHLSINLSCPIATCLPLARLCGSRAVASSVMGESVKDKNAALMGKYCKGVALSIMGESVKG